MSRTSYSAVNLPVLAGAPSSVSNGDIWSTSAGVYARINGATVGPFTTGTMPTLASLFGYTNTATAGGTTTLTVSSTPMQQFSGTQGQTIVLPVVSTLTLGHSFWIDNNSTQALTVNSSGGNLVISVPALTTAICTCQLITGTTAASWDAAFTEFGSVTGTGANVLAASPTLSGTPLAPTAAPDTSTTQVATTAFVLNQQGANTPIMNGTGSAGVSPRYSRQDHVHPSDTTRAALAGATFTGKITAPASATGAAGLNMPHGTAPTTPADGDVWTTTLGVYARINGATVGPFGSGGGITVSDTAPASPIAGQLWFQSSTGATFIYYDSFWVEVGAGAVTPAKGGGTDQVFFENDLTVTSSYTISSGKNAMSAGPVTINSGVTVTVPSGSTWTVV